MDTLDRHSTDAMHWAEEFCKAAAEKGFDPEMDADWLMAWFANYWAAVHDPLNSRIKELESALKEIDSLCYPTLDDEPIAKIVREALNTQEEGSD